MCSICDAERKQSNHWFMARLNREQQKLEVWPWDEADVNVAGVHFICGVAHLNDLVSRYAGWVREQSSRTHA